ncbi:MAG TPA: YihY/virulence factor BrkB family protein [Steroidobacteraceae bacterium]
MNLFRKTYELCKCAARYWSSDNASTTGAALAFYSAFSLAPLLIILLTVAALIVGKNAAYGQIGAQLQGLFGPTTAKVLLNAMQSSQQSQGLVAAITSIVTLLIGATTVLAALEQALEHIWGGTVAASVGIRGWVRTRFLSLGFILTLGFLLLVSLTVTTVLAGIRAQFAPQAAIVGVIGVVDFIISLMLVSSLFALIYRYMPTRRLPWKVVMIGGVLTASLFDAGRWIIGLYLAHSTQASAFGAASSFVALLLWLYYTAQIFLFGAEFTACLGGIRDKPDEAASNAHADTCVAAPVAQPAPDSISSLRQGH